MICAFCVINWFVNARRLCHHISVPRTMKPCDVRYLFRVPVIAALIFGCAAIADGALLSQWNFNSVPPDGMVATGTNIPSSGMGTASLAGGATAIYSTGSSVDPAESDNSDWNTRTYPAQG